MTLAVFRPMGGIRLRGFLLILCLYMRLSYRNTLSSMLLNGIKDAQGITQCLSGRPEQVNTFANPHNLVPPGQMIEWRLKKP